MSLIKAENLLGFFKQETNISANDRSSIDKRISGIPFHVLVESKN
jgi:hypothetical protein